MRKPAFSYAIIKVHGKWMKWDVTVKNHRGRGYMYISPLFIVAMANFLT